MIEIWLTLSAVGAGVMNAIAGGGTLLTFPALVPAVETARAANVTSTFALLPGSLASAWGYRRELAACGSWVKWLTLPSLVGGAIGSLLLVKMPPIVFKTIVPWLVLLAAMLFLFQPWIVKWVVAHKADEPPSHRTLTTVLIAQLLIGVYGGYFGAGIGILMLTSLGFLGLANIHQMNALKSYLAALMNGVSVVFFAFSGEIHWRYALIMAGAAIFGGYFGARLALILRPAAVRWIVIVIAFSLAGYFFWSN